ncbi:hypothetical protein ACJRO7_005415 [Eucalyptus globulus]|uniref:Pentatricopeptide repeat-containing protein n=1 Tax=Eucalyptus globulus TaxID=34317 RepID=A0ABD3J2V6_EUCGL
MHLLGSRVMLKHLFGSTATRETIRFYFIGRASIGIQNRDSYDYTHLLERCRSSSCLKKIHAQIVIGGFEQNPFLAAKLVGAYGDYGAPDMGDARKVFDRLSDRDVFLWNVMIRGYANLGPFEEALNVYHHMRLSCVSANRYTFPFVLKACGAMKCVKRGKVIHAHVVKLAFDLDLYVGNALLAFYAKCGAIEMSRVVFGEIPRKDIVSWNSMISGYTSNGYAGEAIKLFRAMVQEHNFMPDNATLVGILPACAQAAAIHIGFWIHTYIMKSGMEVNAFLASGLISIYGNCGHVKIARDVFNQVCDKNIVVWNAMIRCYGMHGHTDEALNMFSKVVELGIGPDGLMFLCVLSTCSHAGLVSKGWEIFHSMEAYGIQKTEEHYACMVDLLGRARLLDEAARLIETMPIPAGKHVYGALLGASRVHNNIELAEKAAEKLFVLDPDNAGWYILLAKMYEDAGRWQDVARARKLVKEKEIRKPTGCSSVEIESFHHTFGVQDESHPCAQEIFETLRSLEGMEDEELVMTYM